MKNNRIKSFFFAAMALCLIGCNRKPQDIQKAVASTEQSATDQDSDPLTKHPNLVLVGTPNETAYVHPDMLADWLLARKPEGFKQGQVCSCKIDGIAIAVSAPHVVNTPGWAHPIPANEALGQWTSSADGREISFARLHDATKLGFRAEAVEAGEPKENAPAVIKAAQFSIAASGIAVYEAEGVLEKVESSEHLAQFKGFFGTDTAFGDRLRNRAPSQAFFALKISERFREHVRGMSGSLVWQEKKPVGVLVACVLLPDMPPLAIMEPLLGPAKKALEKMK